MACRKICGYKRECLSFFCLNCKINVSYVIFSLGLGITFSNAWLLLSILNSIHTSMILYFLELIIIQWFFWLFILHVGFHCLISKTKENTLTWSTDFLQTFLAESARFNSLFDPVQPLAKNNRARLKGY